MLRSMDLNVLFFFEIGAFFSKKQFSNLLLRDNLSRK